MVDFILILFMIACFYFGLWIGKTYGTIGKWFEAIGKRLSDKDKP